MIRVSKGTEDDAGRTDRVLENRTRAGEQTNHQTARMNDEQVVCDVQTKRSHQAGPSGLGCAGRDKWIID